ncbi:MAG: IS630 family transposase [Thermodesulfobacteriota bacterium]|nr:IS630 family transposase [Thermodesulfobacteriota bacterium]
MKTKKFDGRKLDHKTREQIRIRAVKLVEAGNSPEVVVKALGFHRSAIYQWLSAYHQGGIKALKTRPITGRPSELKSSQVKKLYNIITAKNPLQLKFEFALWTRDMVRDLIKDQFGVRLNVTSVGRLLKKLGFTVRPLYRAYQKNPEKVDKWLNEEYPKIKKLAKKYNAAIFFGDEASVRSDYHKGTTWAPKGQTPVVESTGARFSVNMLSAISARGHLRFMTINGRLNSDRFIEFLKRLIHNADNPIFLIVDGHPTHRSGKVKRYVESTEGRLLLFYLPPYSPELNPDELVWNYVKKHRSKIRQRARSSQRNCAF